MLHHVRAARPQGAVHVQRDRARALEGRLQRPDARAASELGDGDGRAGTSPRPSRCRPTSPRWSPASTTRSTTPTRARTATIPLGHYCRQSLVEHLDRDELVKLTKQGFAFFEEAFDFPYPFEKYDQLYVPEYNMGAMENAGCVTLRDEYLPRSRQDRSFYEFRCSVILHEMAHMWFGDLVTMKLVGRPLAERVVRRVGLLPRRRRGHRVHRVLDRLHQRPQELGATARTSCPAPTRSPPTTTTCRPSR